MIIPHRLERGRSSTPKAQRAARLAELGRKARHGQARAEELRELEQLAKKSNPRLA
jgi:hypothetical protein